MGKMIAFSHQAKTPKVSTKCIFSFGSPWSSRKDFKGSFLRSKVEHGHIYINDLTASYGIFLESMHINMTMPVR